MEKKKEKTIKKNTFMIERLFIMTLLHGNVVFT